MYQEKSFFQKMKEEDRSIKEVADICNVSIRTIYNWEKKHNIYLKRIEINKRARKYNFDESFFEHIDTEEKAYFLGLIMADGWVDKNNKLLGISLKNEDEEILLKFLSLINHKSNPKDKKNKTQKVIYICSKKMISDLSKYSIVSNKTFKIEFPNIKKPLIKHFLRGYYDGDGYIGKKQCVLIISSIKFLNSFLEYFQENFKKEIYYAKIKNSFKVVFSKKDKELIQHLYSDSSIGLKRKKESYEKYWLL